MCFPGSQSPVRRKYELCAFSVCVCALIICLALAALVQKQKMMKHAKYLRKHEEETEETLRKLQKHAETCQRIEEIQWLQSEDSSANRSGRKINRAQDWTTLCSLSAWAWCIFFTSLTRHGPKDVLRPFWLWALSKIYGELWHLLKSIEIYESPWGSMFLSASSWALVPLPLDAPLGVLLA